MTGSILYCTGKDIALVFIDIVPVYMRSPRFWISIKPDNHTIFSLISKEPLSFYRPQQLRLCNRFQWRFRKGSRLLQREATCEARDAGDGGQSNENNRVLFFLRSKTKGRHFINKLFDEIMSIQVAAFHLK